MEPPTNKFTKWAYKGNSASSTALTTQPPHREVVDHILSRLKARKNRRITDAEGCVWIGAQGVDPAAIKCLEQALRRGQRMAQTHRVVALGCVFVVVSVEQVMRCHRVASRFASICQVFRALMGRLEQVT